MGEAAPVLHKVISMLKSMKETGAKILGDFLSNRWWSAWYCDDATEDYSFRVFSDTLLGTNISHLLVWKRKIIRTQLPFKGVMLVPCRVWCFLQSVFCQNLGEVSTLRFEVKKKNMRRKFNMLPSLLGALDLLGIFFLYVFSFLKPRIYKIYEGFKTT